METLSRNPTRTRAHTLAIAILGAALGLAACTGTPWSGGPQATAPADRYQRLMRVAEKAEAGGDLVTAASLYGQAIELEPAQAEPLIALGTVSARMGDADRAAGYFAEALTIAPDNADAIRGYGSALLSLNYTEEAAEQFRQALRVRPGDPRALNGLGVADDLLGRHADAQRSYRSGLAAAPGDDSIQNNLALSLALSGRYDEAIAMLRDIAAEPGHGPRIRQNLALVYALSGRIDDAASVARQDLHPSEVQNNLAFYQSLRGLSGRALAEAVFFANMGGAAEASAQGLAGEADILPASALQAAFEQEPAFATPPVTYVTTLPTRARPAPAPAAQADEEAPAVAEAAADDAETAASDSVPAQPAAATTRSVVAAPPTAEDAAASPPAPAADAEAQPVIASSGAGDGVGGEPASATELATAAEAEQRPAPAAAPTEQQATATADAGEAKKTVSFDDVAWRLRAYLDDDPTVPVPAVPVATLAAPVADADRAADPEAGKDATEETERMAEPATEDAAKGPAVDVTADAEPRPAAKVASKGDPAQTAAATSDRSDADPNEAEVAVTAPPVAVTENQANSNEPHVSAPGPNPEQTLAADAAAQPIEKTAPAAPAVPLPTVEPAAQPQEATAARQFQLQLASVKTEDGARSEWKRMKRRIAPVLPDAEPQYVRARVGSKGYFYRIRVDASPSYSKAQALCTAVSARDIGCLVVPPTD